MERNCYSKGMDALDEILFDRLVNIQSYTDEELKELIEQLGKQEAELSKRRRLLHGEIDILKAERNRRRRDQQEAGESLLGEGHLDVLTDILSGRSPKETQPGEDRDRPSATKPEVEPVIRGIQKRFRDLSVDVGEERVIRYIIKQVRVGRRIDDIMADTYVVAHTSLADRNMLLQNPAVLRAIEDEVAQQFADYGSDVRPKEPGDASE